MIKVGHGGTKLELLSLNVPPSEENKSRGTAPSGREVRHPRALSVAGRGASQSPAESLISPPGQLLFKGTRDTHAGEACVTWLG